MNCEDLQDRLGSFSDDLTDYTVVAEVGDGQGDNALLEVTEVDLLMVRPGDYVVRLRVG